MATSSSRQRYQPLLLVVVNGGRVSMVADEYGMQVTIDTRALAGKAVPKQLNGKVQRRTRKAK